MGTNNAENPSRAELPLSEIRNSNPPVKPTLEIGGIVVDNVIAGVVDAVKNPGGTAKTIWKAVRGS